MHAWCGHPTENLDLPPEVVLRLHPNLWAELNTTKIEECLIIKKRSSSTHSGTWMGHMNGFILGIRRRVPPRVEGRKRLKTLGVDEVHGASPVVTIGFYSKSWLPWLGWCLDGYPHDETFPSLGFDGPLSLMRITGWWLSPTPSKKWWN